MTKESQVIIGISIGKSFAEISALDSHNEEVAFKRWYIPRENVLNGIQKFLNENEELSISKVFVASQYLEKLFDFKLGGSVAQLVTRGFEKWCYLKQPAVGERWKHQQRAPTLSIMDHWIPVSERVAHDGHMERELSDGELDSTLDYIKAHEVKRICVHFLNSSKNSHNQEKAVQYFTKHGYDVFAPQMNPQDDETACFRENTFNASMTGTWEELCSEIEKAFDGKVPVESIYYLTGRGFFNKEKNLRWQTLLGFANAQSQVIPRMNERICDVLHLGLEKFELINTQSTTNEWQTAWGPVKTEGPQTHRLNIQPDSSIEVNTFGELDISQTTHSFEPGPVLMGRGLKPLVFDLFHEEFTEEDEIEGITSLLSSSGKTRFKNSLTAIVKSSPRDKREELEDVISQLKALCAHKLMNEVLWKMQTSELVVTGYFSELLRAEIEDVFKTIFHIRLKFIESSDSDIVARRGVL